jgi:hypothetical protein
MPRSRSVDNVLFETSSPFRFNMAINALSWRTGPYYSWGDTLWAAALPES